MTGLVISADLAPLPIDAVTSTFGILAKKGAGKALALDTPIATPTGWTTMGEVAEGDTVFDERGEPCRVTRVTDVMHDHVCYRVTFDDGSELVADAEHLWLTSTHASRIADQRPVRVNRRAGRPQCERTAFPALRTTEQIRATLRRRGEREHAINTCGPLRCPYVELPIDPYVLGAWLGDGSSACAHITSADEGVLAAIRAAGYVVREVLSQRQEGCATYHVGGLYRQLKDAGLLKNKHVPPLYLRASETARRALLAGLMDTDGHASGGSSYCYFYNTNERLADAAEELAASLGWKVRRREKRAVLKGVDHGPCFEVGFRPIDHVFRLERKRARLRLDCAQQRRFTQRMIESVEPVASVPVRCIAVDSPSHLYLAGRSFIPTHNTHTASVLAEEMIGAGLRICVLDPVGAWWGLRSSADGERPGLPVIVIGGERADVELREGMGAELADLVVDGTFSCVIDTSLLESKASVIRFALAFAKRIYHRNRTPLHLFIDEADMFAPQKPMGEDAALLGAMENIVRRGRQRGLGVTMITQRAAVLNKNVLSQIDTLAILRTTSPQDRDAIDDWIEAQASKDDRKRVIDTLPSLKTGEAWIWSPAMLEVLVRVQIRRRQTFDSSATPKVGEVRIEPKQLAPVDIDAIRKALAPKVEAKKAAKGGDDLDELFNLTARVAELEAQLARHEEAVCAQETGGDVLRALFAEALAVIDSGVAQLRSAIELADRPITDVPVARVAEAVVPIVSETVYGPGRIDVPHAPAGPRPPAPRATPAATASNAGLKAGARRILGALAAFHPKPLTRAQVAAQVGIAPTGTTFSAYISALSTRDLIEKGDGDLRLTTAGLKAAGPVARPTTTAELVAVWGATLKAGARSMLDALVAVYPRAMTRDALARRVQIDASGTTFSAYVSALSTRGLVEKSGQDLRASSSLFMGARA